MTEVHGDERCVVDSYRLRLTVIPRHIRTISVVFIWLVEKIFKPIWWNQSLDAVSSYIQVESHLFSPVCCMWIYIIFIIIYFLPWGGGVPLFWLSGCPKQFCDKRPCNLKWNLFCLQKTFLFNIMLFGSQNSSLLRGGNVPMKFKLKFLFLWTLIFVIYSINSNKVTGKYFNCMPVMFVD